MMVETTWVCKAFLIVNAAFLQGNLLFRKYAPIKVANSTNVEMVTSATFGSG